MTGEAFAGTRTAAVRLGAAAPAAAAGRPFCPGPRSPAWLLVFIVAGRFGWVVEAAALVPAADFAFFEESSFCVDFRFPGATAFVDCAVPRPFGPSRDSTAGAG